MSNDLPEKELDDNRDDDDLEPEEEDGDIPGTEVDYHGDPELDEKFPRTYVGEEKE